MNKNVKQLTILFLLICLFFISPLSADDLLDQNDFNDGVILPWHISESAETNSDFDLINGEYVIHIFDGGANKWDVQIRHRGLTIEQGHTYTVKFKIRSSTDTQVYAKIGTQGPPYNEYWNNNWSNISLPANQDVLIEDSFTMTSETDNLCEFAFHLGGSLTGNTPLDIYFDDIYLEDPDYVKPDPPEPLAKPDVRVNQLGYFPQGKKRATILNTSTSPLNWHLKDSSGTEVASGVTTVFGHDIASGDFVHIADFSDYTNPGTDFTLCITVDSEEKASHKFDIRGDLYRVLKYDALQYFYHNRSGIAIEMPYAGQEDLTRPAGHPSDIMNTWPDTGQENYSLDVTGGWYDAGDHGKYVVNGGISVWTMMNQYERTLHIAGADGTSFADGTMNIPEQNNGYPDILDEARWQMEMLLKMQVPDDKQQAGMVHHKGHDENWTPLATRPDQDTETRYLRPVSTAATLNLAATAAQSARIWQNLDPTFAQTCLEAAVKAWNAAKLYPDIYAPLHKIGGGPYNDNYVEDEFYWAACELFVTTGDEEYQTYIENSQHYLIMPTVLANGEDEGLTGVFTWGSTNGLGTVTLALVPNQLSSSEIITARQNIQSAADYFLNVIEQEGYLLPMAVSQDGGYPWGSNSFILNEMIVMGLAYDFTGNLDYYYGVSESMDYLMGRNAMDQNYVTGYGERPLVNPHHRFWANQADPTFPLAPAGAVSGGPNSGLEDPWARGAGLEGSPPQKCFVDHIESWSTNEITINWNAPLAWVTAFLDETKGPVPLSITITSPQNGSNLAEGDLLIETLTSGENIQQVDFYLNNTLIGSATGEPYQFLVTGLTEGTYAIKATITDGIETVESLNVEFTVVKDLIPPVVSISSPTNNAEFAEGTPITITAIASDEDGQISKVEFFNGTTLIGTDTISPYEAVLENASIGNHTLSAKATDNDGLATLSPEVSITVKDTQVTSDLVIQYACDSTDSATQHIKGKINIVNNGTTNIHLNDLAVRYYF
ncbi:MAG: glycoside hydrolase family 9 protein, partial [Spirochaetes bacterium]|nr:glycoside hydrolase family 9 protein [Spirochaetota bacterium]